MHSGTAYLNSIFSILMKPRGTATSPVPLALAAMTPRRGVGRLPGPFKKAIPAYGAYVLFFSDLDKIKINEALPQGLRIQSP